MSVEDLMDIRARLRIMWKNVMPDGNAVKVWYDTFRSYDFETIDKACIEYMKGNRFQPNPADILMCIPAKVADAKKVTDFKPMYVTTPDGVTKRAFKCLRCRDTGLIVWEDKDRCYVGRPCTCEAAIANYGTAVRAAAYSQAGGGE